MISGVDVSNWQGSPANWRNEAGPIDWAAVKITELGTGGNHYVNPDAAADWAWLREAGKGRIGYFFAHPSMSASATVALFVTTMRQLGVLDTDGIALDLETTDGLRASSVADWSATVLGLLQREFSRLPLCYTFRAFAEAGNCAGLARYPLWIADPSAPAGHPRVPSPWNTWAIHQHSWTPLDKDVAAYPTLAAMQAHLGKSGPPPIPEPLEDPVLILNGADAETPIALPDNAKTVRLAATGDTTVSVQFAGHATQPGVKLSWGHGQSIPVPNGAHSLRVWRDPAGNPGVPVSAAIS